MAAVKYRLPVRLEMAHGNGLVQSYRESTPWWQSVDHVVIEDLRVLQYHFTFHIAD